MFNVTCLFGKCQSISNFVNWLFKNLRLASKLLLLFLILAFLLPLCDTILLQYRTSYSVFLSVSYIKAMGKCVMINHRIKHWGNFHFSWKLLYKVIPEGADTAEDESLGLLSYSRKSPFPIFLFSFCPLIIYFRSLLIPPLLICFSVPTYMVSSKSAAEAVNFLRSQRNETDQCNSSMATKEILVVP